jgi:acyl-CoA synthetase (AMP-forming)/AMP-acid ligase II
VAVDKSKKASTSRQLRQIALYVGRGRIAPSQQTLLELFAETIEKAPYEPVLDFEGVTLNYQDLETSSKTLATWMIKHAQIKPGDRIAIYLPNSISYGVAIYAAWLARAVVVNLGMSAQLEDVVLLRQVC